MNKKKYWLESKAFDSSLWLGTLAFAACFILIAKLIGFSGGIGFWGFLFLVVGFDVSHVYGTLYRVYMDKAE
ncbi:MAG: hypothetical protein OEZ36_01655, partial [Spirochaetota bacterium]|nr:hypothetical protein [Spirochaetota bacterium]